MNTSDSARTAEVNAWIRDLPVYEPGKPMDEVARELGFDSIEDIIKLASNENVLGPAPAAVRAMREAATSMHLYPDGGCFRLRQAIASRLDVRPDQILAGNGSNELIELLGHLYLSPNAGVVVADRAFVVYKMVAAAFRAEVVEVPMMQFTHDLDRMLDAITPRTRLLFVGNPNNPTGTMVSEGELDRLVARLPPKVTLVLDEAYIEILDPARQPDSLKYARQGCPVWVLRTFSKTYGLAGLRLGYGVAPAPLIALANRARQPFNVNAMAQVAAVAALEDQEHVLRTRKLVKEGLDFLAAGLDKLGVPYIPSVANFMLVRVGEGRRVFQSLLQQRVIVRPMDGYRLPEYIRVTVGTREQNQTFLGALAKTLAAGQESEA